MVVFTSQSVVFTSQSVVFTSQSVVFTSQYVVFTSQSVVFTSQYVVFTSQYAQTWNWMISREPQIIQLREWMYIFMLTRNANFSWWKTEFQISFRFVSARLEKRWGWERVTGF